MNHTIHPSLVEDFKTREKFLKTNNPQILNRLIDATLLKVNASEEDFLNLFSHSEKLGFKSVCIPPSYVKLAKKECKNTLVCTVVGFPNGYNTTNIKVHETKEAIDLGADEIDFVNNVTFIKSGNLIDLKNEYQDIVKAAQGRITKLILETSLLTDSEIIECTTIAANAGVNIIKTSTGFGGRGASKEDLELIQETLKSFFGNNPPIIGIKASGGIRTKDDLIKMVMLGATRIGTSNIQILE